MSTSDFDLVAKDIVNNYFCSALCIDDKYIEPFDGNGIEEPSIYREPSKQLYNSFRDAGCCLDIFRYENMVQWKEREKSLLGKKDLLILDWELTGNDPSKDALEILYHAVYTERIPFVVIYTHTTDLQNVNLQIHSFFEFHFDCNDERERFYDEMCGEIERNAAIEEVNVFLRSLKSDFTNFAYYDNTQRGKEIKNEIMTKISEKTGSQIGSFRSTIESKLGSLDKAFKFMACFYNDCFFGSNEIRDAVKHIDSSNENISYMINLTTVVVIRKRELLITDGIQPQNLFKHFSDIISKPPRNFLSLLSIEMKSLFIKECGRIGNRLMDIDEKAFLHHKNMQKKDHESGASEDSKEEFFDFLKNNWANEMTFFISEQNPNLFGVIDDYLNTIVQSGAISPKDSDLVKLNYYYSFVFPEKRTKRKIGFGDVFKLSHITTPDTPHGYVMCITNHCDCIRPDKIGNQLLFVFGVKMADPKKALRKAESENRSFLMKDDQPLCIEWDTKPFSLHIAKVNNIVEGDNIIKVCFRGNPSQLKYIATQKENYTQKIANAAFGHAARVGIELCQIKDENER